MKDNLLKILVISLVLAASNAFSRSPAVENFFSLEHESMNKQRLPSDVKSGFEFKKTQKIVTISKSKAPSTGFAISTLVGLFALFALPFSAHLVISILNKNKNQTRDMSTVEIISKYKKVVKDTDSNVDEDIKKAS